jgi:predicted enzyme related to lactoylglutathione lyase
MTAPQVRQVRRCEGAMMGNRIAYFEVGAQDHETLVSFYRDLFGWRLEDAADGYAMIDTRAGGINGGIGRSSDGSPWVSFYAAAEDPQAVLDRAQSLGGTTVVPVTEVPGVVTFAMFNDPDGNLVGVIRAAGPAPGDAGAGGQEAEGGVAVDWFEVLGSDAERTQRFYCDLFGWRLHDSSFSGYRLVDTQSGEGAIGGGLGSGDGSTWATVYAHVPDVEAALAKAVELGGSRAYGPNQVDDHTRTGAFRDPAGNLFGVYEHAPH